MRKIIGILWLVALKARALVLWLISDTNDLLTGLLGPYQEIRSPMYFGFVFPTADRVTR